MTMLRISKGPALSNTYLSVDGKDINQLTIDWSYDAIYFKEGDEDWIILSIGPLTEKNDIFKLDTNEKRASFKKLAIYTLNELRGYSESSDKALDQLLIILDYII